MSKIERVVKTITGYHKESDKKSATHVILGIDEYDNLQMELYNFKKEKEIIIKKANNEIRQCIAQKDEHVKDIVGQARKRIESLQNDFKKANNEITRVNGLNANLKRICKERANAKRGIKPKKEHHGYLIIDRQQYSYILNFKDKKKNRSFPCWKVRVQSPYDSSIPYEIVQKEINNDLIKLYGFLLNINHVYSNGTLENLRFDEFNNLWQNNKNFIFKTLYKSNMKSGFWEVDCFVKNNLIMERE